MMMTISNALEQGIRTLTQESPQTARLDTQVLLSYVLNVERSTVYAYPERELTSEQEQQFLSLLKRRVQGEPVAYLLGREEFYGRDFLVDKRVLIPRPETELLVEAALDACQQMLDGGHVPIVADIGTGSGVIPITVALEESRLPNLYASDISVEALEVAQLNCQRYHVEQRVHLLHGDLLAVLPEPVDVITANLPYVGTNEMDILERDVADYEPYLALFSGPNGLDLLQRFFMEAKTSDKLAKRAVLLLEIGYQQREVLTTLLQEIWPQAVVTFRKDYAGWDRLLHVAT